MQGTKNIEGISLDLRNNIEEKVEFGPSAFEGMHNLRLLGITEIWGGDQKIFPKGLRYLPNALRYLHWHKCALKSFPSNFTPQNLVELNLSDCQLKQLWNGVQVKIFNWCHRFICISFVAAISIGFFDFCRILKT